jgi:hypothetical protein
MQGSWLRALKDHIDRALMAQSGADLDFERMKQMNSRMPQELPRAVVQSLPED